MRPHGRGRRDSLYFDYPEFAPPNRTPGEARRGAVIVGAGPVGLLAALELARNDVPSLVIERNDTYNDGSRAICIQRQSFHILERAGALAPFLRKALGWTEGTSYYRGHTVLDFAMPHGPNDKFLPMYNIQQQFIEQYLHEAAVATGMVAFRWGTTLADVDNGADGVTLDLRDDAGAYSLEADWLLAADGARSTARAALGLRLDGENYEGRYAIADIRAAIDYPTRRRAFFDPKSNPGRTVLVHRQPDDIWRVDYQLAPDEPTEDALREDVVRRNVEAILAEIGHHDGYDLEWWSVYAANTLALDDYRHGRTLFIGDSAHIVPIFGVRGLNNGLADAENVGWKLARVIKGEADPQLLDSYAVERRDATMDVFRNAAKSTRFMTPPSAGWRTMREAALSLAIDHAFVRPLANPRQMTPHSYERGPLAIPDDPGFEGGPAPGAILPNVRLGSGRFLSDLLGPGFTCFVFGDVDTAELMGRLLSLDPMATIVAVPTSDAAVWSAFAAKDRTAYLARPDMYVAGRWRRAEADGIGAALESLLRPGEPA